MPKGIFIFNYIKPLKDLKQIAIDKNRQLILSQCETDIDIWYCHKYDIKEAIKELNKYYYEYHEIDIDMFKLIII